ncbi:MAG: L-threonylcarbamoyladenylate synthase [Alicycliphilus sp.]|nr:L-threonylcarbamoyladenylate synthase [Alicycliphilus sp.]
MIEDGNAPQAIAAAVDALAAGQLIGLPTETVYGLAADASNDAAVRAIFAAKGRPADHPLIVHVASAEAVGAFAIGGGESPPGGPRSLPGSQAPGLGSAPDLPQFAQKLIDAFWPGPLTLILPRRPGVADAAAGGHPTIGLRCPSHPVAHAVLAAAAARGMAGLAAPSANRFGRISPTTAAHVAAEFGDALRVLDGGACDVGIESTIIDCSRSAPVLLRPGQVARARIEQVMGTRLLSKEELSTPTPQAPGTLLAHYAPRARLRLMNARELRTGLDMLGADAKNIAVWARAPLQTASSQLILRRMPDDADAAAQQLFAVLRGFDEAQVKLIWVEAVPDDAAWDGVRDRLARAAVSA